MASWKEIDRIRKDPKAAAAIAKRLLTLPRSDFTDWEVDFLGDVARRGNLEEFTTRQIEKLLEIRDGVEEVAKIAGFSVPILLSGCLQARLDLGEDDEEWIKQRCERSTFSIKRKFAGRLMRCARELHLVEEEFA